MHSVVGESHPFRHIFYRLDTGSIQVVIVLPCLDELVLLDVFLHLLPREDKVVVPAVHLVVPPWPSGVFGGRTNKKTTLVINDASGE